MMNELEKAVALKYARITGANLGCLDSYRLEYRSENPTGFLTEFELSQSHGDQRQVYSNLPEAITSDGIKVGFLVYLVGKKISAIEGFIADANEIWEDKNASIKWQENEI